MCLEFETDWATGLRNWHELSTLAETNMEPPLQKNIFAIKSF